jgi:hypothetical protein
MPAMTTLHLLPDPIAVLWQGARAWLADTLRLFGGPATIARSACAAFKRRLALLESLIMKLLLIEAARQSDLNDAGVETHKAARPAAPGPRRRAAEEDAARSETWRVRFRPRMPRRARHGASAQRPAPRLRHARPDSAHAMRLARRFEALRRVLADPRRAIATLARKLRALAARAYAAARAIAMSSPRQGGGMVHAHALVHACDWSRIFRNSS